MTALKDLVWGFPTLAVLLIFGIYFSLKTRFFYPKTVISTAKTLSLSLKKPKEGGISPLSSIATALGGTVGVGSIIGMGYGIAVGGVGSIFWMWVCSFFGMGLKYAEVKVSVSHKHNRGGAPFRLESMGFGKTAVVFCILCILASFGTGNLTQTGVISSFFVKLGLKKSLAAMLVGGIVGFAVFGGQKRIAKLNSIIIPLFAGFYIVACTAILVINRNNLLPALKSIFTEAFGFSPMAGGFSGAAMAGFIREGFARSIFSNEAGMGSSPLAHGTSSEKDSDIQGRWGIFEIFFDTFIVSTLTALAIISSPDGDMEVIFTHCWGKSGGFLFSLTLSLLAFASVISWCYYAHCCLDFLFPQRALPRIVYRALFSLTSALAVFFNTQQIWELSDILNALMMMPNLFLLYKCRKEIERIK